MSFSIFRIKDSLLTYSKVWSAWTFFGIGVSIHGLGSQSKFFCPRQNDHCSLHLRDTLNIFYKETIPLQSKTTAFWPQDLAQQLWFHLCAYMMRGSPSTGSTGRSVFSFQETVWQAVQVLKGVSLHGFLEWMSGMSCFSCFGREGFIQSVANFKSIHFPSKIAF